MNSLTQVLNRIHEIEYRFGAKPLTVSTNFSALLQKETGKAGTGSVTAANGTGASGAITSAGDTDIAKMLNVAAQKYGVDPKLVSAIAKAESDFNPDVVSSAGAVGVMQLMPETAAALGVRNINDPRENIDGGVAYLKQLLTAFDGDTTRAVAAYNAGPQAVKDYDGVPPYAETRAYVNKVLSLCK